MSNLLSLKFWLNIRPGALLPIYQKALIIFIVVLAVLILVFTVLGKRKSNLYNRIWRSLRSFSISNVIIGLLILFFTFETVPLLSARFWFIVWGVEIVIWLFFVLRIFVEIPKKKERLEKEKEYNKYIP
jgi:amino acid transporter